MEKIDELTRVFREVFDDDSLVLNDEMTADDLDAWDSLSHINLIIAVELTFGIEFKHSEVQSFANVGELLSQIKDKTSKI